MKARDPLLGPPPSRDRWGAPGRAPPSPKRPRRKLAWLTYGHLAFGIAALIGWEHLDVFWPSWLWPDGVSVGGERRMAGLLTVGDPGRPASLTTSRALLSDWRAWIEEDLRPNSSECLALPQTARSKLQAGAEPRAGTAGMVQYWVRSEPAVGWVPPGVGKLAGYRSCKAPIPGKSSSLSPAAATYSSPTVLCARERAEARVG